jgi:hypothetical protein
MNRRAFLGTLGVFSILPGAGRVWRAIRPVRRWVLVRPYYNYNDVESVVYAPSTAADQWNVHVTR